ncbi:MAG: GNAT family acetyltransferase [Candidatus Thiodiazotropha sp. L084R]
MGSTIIQLKNAELSEIDEVLDLHYRYQIDSISEEDKADGFVTTPFTKKQMADLINIEKGLFIAKKDGVVVAYVMAASWSFWSVWPLFAFMIKELPNLEYHGQKMDVENSYQYGPVCIDKSVRGTGVLEKIFEYAKLKMSERFQILVTFVNKANERSYQAHKRKLGLDIIQEFKFNGSNYYEMACLTKQNINQIKRDRRFAPVPYVRR